MTVKLPRIRPYFSYSVFCYLTTTNITVMLQTLFGMLIISEVTRWGYIEPHTPITRVYSISSTNVIE